MAIEGPLRELPLSDVFQLLDLSRKTGMLTVHAEGFDRPALIRFDRGAIAGAELPEDHGRLGKLLMRSGKISEIEMERVLREQKLDPGVPFGTIAVRLGVVTVADVKRQLGRQIEETVFDLFRCTDGYFRFEECPPLHEGVLPIRIPTQSLLMEAARRMDEWASLAAEIPHPRVVPVLEEEGEGSLDLKPHEWEVLAEIDGERTLKQIAIELGRSDFEVAKTVHDLLASRVVAVAEVPISLVEPAVAGELTTAIASAEQALAAGRLTEAQQSIEWLVREHGEATGIALLVGRLLVAQGRWHEAVEALSRAVRLDPLAGEAHFYLGFAAARCGDLRRAEHAWSTYLRLPEGRGRDADATRRALRAAMELREALEEVVE
jgi:tetratricopeptide (TPR) repeat protein